MYNDVLQSYPNIIDISDGKHSFETADFYAPRLWSYYEDAENVAAKNGEWHSLIAWILYQVLHGTARDHYLQGKFIFTKEIDKDRFRELLITNLQIQEFEDMFNEFTEYEKINGIFK